MRIVLRLVVISLAGLAALPAFAQDSMSKEHAMKSDSMSHHAMKSDSMSKSAMKHRSMKKDSMSKDSMSK